MLGTPLQANIEDLPSTDLCLLALKDEGNMAKSGFIGSINDLSILTFSCVTEERSNLLLNDMSEVPTFFQKSHSAVTVLTFFDFLVTINK